MGGDRTPTFVPLLVLAAALQVVVYCGYFNLTPLLPQVGADLGLNPAALGAVFGAGGIVSLLVQLPAGTGADAFGRRRFFVGGMVLVGLALLVRWQAEQSWQLLVSQLVAGAALGAVSTNAFALMAGGPRQGHAFGFVNAGINIGQVVGYLAAGTLGVVLGWRGLSLALTVLPLSMLLVLSRVGGLRAHAERGAARPGPRGVLRTLSHPRRLALSALAALTLAAGQGACFLLPFAVQTDQFGALAAAVVLVPYVVGSVVAAPFSGALAARFGARRTMGGALVLGVGACAAAMVWGGSILALALCNVLIGVSVNTTLPVASVEVVTMRVGARSVGAGAALAGLRFGQSLGPFIGPTVVGVMLARSGVEAAWLALAVLLALALGLHGASAALPSS